MIAPALVDGKPLSHPSLDRVWAAFAHHGISPVFHVADQPKVFDEAWYSDRAELGISAVDSVLLYVPAALACTDLILNGVLERHPDLRLGIVELSAVWVPLYLMMLDGGSQFVRRLDGRERGSRCARAITSSARSACLRSPTSCPRTSNASSAEPIC